MKPSESKRGQDSIRENRVLSSFLVASFLVEPGVLAIIHHSEAATPFDLDSERGHLRTLAVSSRPAVVRLVEDEARLRIS
jgi:hypothetical protein